MQPFDLEGALAGDKVVTRDGREVNKIKWHIKEWILEGFIDKDWYLWFEEGRHSHSRYTPLDLFMAE